jgi:hypothetical protein
MSDSGPRTGAARDVPPPRPVPSPPAVAEENGLARAARAVAEAVAGMVAGRSDESGPADTSGPAGADGKWSAMSGLRDVVGAVASTVGAALGGERRTADETSRTETPGPSSGDRAPTALLSDVLAAAAPRLPIRDADRLRQAYPGASDDEIADALVARTARLTSGIGAATGGFTAAHWFAPASLLMLPLELGAETVLIGGVEVVLIGELHELYGRRPPGDARARASAYLASWSAQRSVDGVVAGLGSLLGVAGIRAVRRQVTRRMARGIPVAAPFLIGAALSSRGNRRATESLAQKVLADLRASRPRDAPGDGRG